MPRVLLCSAAPLDDELARTVLWREDVQRSVASSAEEALRLVPELAPNLVAVDRDLPEAAQLIASLRANPITRQTSLLVFARGEFEPGEVDLLQAGANAILRLPPDDEWDERLSRLMTVATRRDVRFPAQFEVEARSGAEVESVLVMALNLSVRGLLVESYVPLRLGEDVDFRWLLPGSSTLIKGCGRVVREATRTRFGIEFYGLEGDGAARVKEFVEAAG